MKYQVLGPRILLRVRKTEETYENSSIVVAEAFRETETTAKTVAEVEEIGPTALTDEDYGLKGANVQKGDKVHFQRYGAVRLKSIKEDKDEFWIINAKDLLCKEV